MWIKLRVQLYFYVENKMDKTLPGERYVFLRWIVKIASAALILSVFFLAIDLMAQSLSHLGFGTARELIKVAEAPFIALFIGLLTTALLQSSSTVTSIAVVMVASGTITLNIGIFIIMGANIGTTLTSDIVSLGFVTDKGKFRKALSAGVIHDFFNILTAVLIFPLEYYYGFLSKSATYMAGLLGDQFSNANNSNSIVNLPGFTSVIDFLYSLINNYWILAAFSILLLFVSLKVFSRYTYKLLIGGSKDKLKNYVFNNPLKSFSWGLVLTGILQSSSVTTSLVIPLVANRKVMLKAVFPYIMGANIGTTITALLAAALMSEAAVSLAIAHLIFNLAGVSVFFLFSITRKVPVYLAGNFGRLASENKLIGFFYIIFTFFLIPFFLIYLSQR